MFIANLPANLYIASTAKLKKREKEITLLMGRYDYIIILVVAKIYWAIDEPGIMLNLLFHLFYSIFYKIDTNISPLCRWAKW